MKWFLCATMLFVTAAALAQQQPSPADLARSSRQQAQSRPAKIYDNDSLPTQAPITVLGSSAAAENATGDARAEGDSANPAEPKPKVDELEARKKLEDSWRSKLADQRKEVGTLQRELDILQREYRLRSATMYADPGNSLRDPTKWAADDREYQQQITDKSKQLDAARQKLDGLREDARKAGMPASVTD